MSDFITDVERQYEMYCKIAEEHGFIDLNAKKNGFRCTTKSNEFNAGWIAFTGAVAAVRDEQQAKIEKLEIELSTTKQVLGNVIDMEVAKVDDLKAQLNNMEACYIEKKKECEELQGQIDASKSSQPKLHKTEIGDCLHFSTTMFHDGKATCFDCDAVVNHKREVIGVMQTKPLRGERD